MNKPKSYPIRSLQDIMKIPAARRPAFYAEFPSIIDAMEEAYRASLLKIDAMRYVPLWLKNWLAKRVVVAMNLTWIDDGERKAVVDFQVLGGERKRVVTGDHIKNPPRYPHE